MKAAAVPRNWSTQLDNRQRRLGVKTTGAAIKDSAREAAYQKAR